MNENVVVSAEWLADNLGSVRVVDVRDAWEYDGIGHIPGAVNIPFDTFRSEKHAAQSAADSASGDAASSNEGMLPGVDVWEELLGDAGITPDDTIVAYDDNHGVFAARFLVTAELYGHENLHLLDGDYSAWSREHEVSRDEPDVEPVTYEVDRPAETPLVGFEEVVDAIDSDAVILDTREDWEYAEGHIPGAVQLDWRELVDNDTRGLKSREELEAILESRGVTHDRHVVLYCNTARRISHTYTVLSHLGYEDVAFYEGSMTEWEERGGPIETAE